MYGKQRRSNVMPEASLEAHSRVQTRNDVLSILSGNEEAIRKFGATALYLFGSAARDELSPDSDVDLFVDYDSINTFGFVELFELKEFLAAILERKIDLTSRKGLHPKLRARIERSSVRVF